MPLKTLKYFVRSFGSIRRSADARLSSSNLRASSLTLLNGMQNLLEYSVMPLMPKGEI